ncbi:unnamed protein product [Cochlearia groenlandica]
MARNAAGIEMPESEENEFASLSLFSPSRAPLNSIPDPSQLQKANHQTLVPEKRFEISESRGGNANGAHGSNGVVIGRNGKSRSEPNSAQSTPTRNGARVSLGGGCATGARVGLSFGGRGTSSKIPRAISMADSVSFVESAPRFELNEDRLFWKEHSVQVLIRLRPLNTMEKGSQGHGRCLKQESPQTLVWLGHPETRFTFDHVASETISQERLFRVAGLPMVENCLSGYNSCVFAYGQTGSGKTYTMMGEISEADGSLSEDCGVTARIFEYLFSRIKMEEEGRRDEKLKFSCKCSFLEIYNEQITDLLEPSSTNLQLREDLGKGVYVENLVEHNVRTVNDVLKLLLQARLPYPNIILRLCVEVFNLTCFPYVQGAVNRKIAATRMNSESSRSHSVFTCTLESLWERDSLTHSRFARLNLVDLAGSERQKSSGAEGDRLKEAANINKSLSTLGLVIMSLVDLAHGKHRHVPYRDSRLTFLLQDSLGGNSKTMIIANVSPSLCSTNETLSTLKFAQRAKLIQNNAKVNEDASGDVTALQQEIRKLKVQLSSLMKNHNSCEALSDCTDSLDNSRYSGTLNESQDLLEKNNRSMIMRTDKSSIEREAALRIEGYETELSGMVNNIDALVKTDKGIESIDRSILQLKLGKVIKDLEEARTLNCQYEKEQKSQLSQQQDIEVVRDQVETETARTILELQEEVIALQCEFQKQIYNLEEENQSLKDTVTAREAEIRALNQDWEKATLELTNFISVDPVSNFFDRFEAVNATMKEADLTLCELVRANENSKHITGVWLQTHEEQMVKQKNLTDDLGQVKSTLSACKQENQILINQTHSSLLDMENSVSLLEEYFLDMKRGVEETLEALFSHVRLAGRELLQLISNSRTPLEQVVSDYMEREFTMYATYQCHIGKLLDQILSHRKHVISPHFAEEENQQLSHESLLYENLYLKKELERKEALFEGLRFDFRLLQESASDRRDIKNEVDELFDALCKVQLELELKASQVRDLFVHNENLENCSIELKTALFTSKSDLEQAKERIQILTEQNDELSVLVRDLCMEKVAAEEGLDEQKDLVKRLEKEILHLTPTAEKQLLSAVKSIEENLKKSSNEKDQLVEEIVSLNHKLELAYATADAKEAIAVESRQESEASKIYAEQKEEEVKILEISIEELERTVNILERRVYDMDEEVKRHRTTQDSLETELQALRQRLFRFENFTGAMVPTNDGAKEYESQISRSVILIIFNLQDANRQIQVFQKEIAEQTKEIKQLKEYISEILLHSEAQASTYQEKYKTLEVMIRDFKLEDSSSSGAETIAHKTEKSSIRSRGSSSPFRCIVGLVQQMKLEKDQELTMARVRVEELESLLSVKQKEVCTLTTRIAAADSMTHDVIRDLLGVKMDITSYAELIDQHQVQRIVEEAKQHAEEILSKDQELINLRRHIDALVKERESCMSELNKKDTDVLTSQISLDQLQERVQLLSMQNEMLKNDKSNLLRKLAELDRAVHDARASNQRVPQKAKDTVSFKLADTDYTKRLENAQKLLSHANNELAKYRKTSNNNNPSTRTQGQSSGTRYR